MEQGVHYLIGKNGQITQVFPHDAIMTYFAGRSYFKGDSSLNKNSIGIMLGNKGWPEQGDLYSEQQIKTLKDLVESLKVEYPQAQVLELAEVATDRHIALGNFFPRSEFKEMVKLPENTSYECRIKSGDSGEAVTELQTKLSQFGYGSAGAALSITGVYDEATLKVADIFHKVHVNYANFELREVEGFAEKLYVPSNMELLAVKTDAVGENPATPHCWSDADEYVLNQLLGLNADSRSEASAQSASSEL